MHWFIPCRCCIWRDVAAGELDLPIVDVESDGLGDLSVADVASGDAGVGVANPILRIISHMWTSSVRTDVLNECS